MALLLRQRIQYRSGVRHVRRPGTLLNLVEVFAVRGNMTRVDSIEHLRRIIGEPKEVTRYKITRCLQPEAVEFIRRSPFLFLATANADGRPDVFPRGDESGLVAVENSGHLVIPERPGNRLLMSLQNILVNPRVALIFLVPGTEETLRVG